MNEPCPRCGTVNPPDSSFCMQCGTSLHSPTPPKPHGWMEEGSGPPPRRVVPQPSLTTRQPARPRPNLFPCSDCGHMCSRAAAFCPNCGRPFAAPPAQHRQPAPPPVTPAPYVPQPPGVAVQHVHHYHPVYPARQVWHPGVAGVLSFIFPGAGQIYKGNVGAGVVWFFVVMLGYLMLIVPGLILHIICVCTAAAGDPYRRGG